MPTKHPHIRYRAGVVVRNSRRSQGDCPRFQTPQPTDTAGPPLIAIAGDALDSVRPRGVPPPENRLGGRGERARAGRPSVRRDRLGPASRFP